MFALPRFRFTRGLFAVFAALLLMNQSAKAITLSHDYSVTSNTTSHGYIGVSFWPSWGGQPPASDFGARSINLGSFTVEPPTMNWSVDSQGHVVTSTATQAIVDYPFEIQIVPRNPLPSTLPGYHYTTYGPQTDGAVIHGLLNGVLASDGTSHLVATFQSVTGYDLAGNLAQTNPGQFVVDPAIANMFPINSIVLPGPLNLTPPGSNAIGRYIDLSVTLVPEPVAFLTFLPLIAILAYRRRQSIKPTREDAPSQIV